MLVDAGLLVLGLSILWVGGEALVAGATGLARRLGVSALVIGLTVVAFGTSAPEVAVSVLAGARGADSIAVGNIVGSNIANILLILGIAALVRPLLVSREIAHTDGPIMVGVGAAFILFAIDDDRIGRGHGVVFLLALVGYTFLSYQLARRQPRIAGVEVETGWTDRGGLWLLIPLVVGGIGLLVFGADVMVGAGTRLAAQLGVPDRIIGLTIISLGTSLPELSTCIVAARRGQADLAIGNVVGSNIFNILCVLGLASVVHPLQVEPAILNVDSMVMLGASLMLLPIIRIGHLISRREGVLFLTLYAGYIAYLSSQRTPAG